MDINADVAKSTLIFFRMTPKISFNKLFFRDLGDALSKRVAKQQKLMKQICEVFYTKI
jgi:hypothetical protein